MAITHIRRLARQRGAIWPGTISQVDAPDRGETWTGLTTHPFVHPTADAS